MSMTSRACVLLTVATIVNATPALADDSRSASHVLGIQDLQTGGFRRLNAIVPDSSTTSTTTGTVEVTFNVKLVSSFAKGTPLRCDASVNVAVTNETTGTGTYFEETAIDGVDISGTTATCTAKIPYAWLLPPSSATNLDLFTGSYTVSATPVTSSGAPPATGILERSSTGNFVSTNKIPSSGTTSQFTVNVTL